ncbi:MAG TPA: DUF748 domain-containing protein, partial [Opitutus sp.]|nr:DUF748 domain-containing protein [Opitutus sp.]
KVALTGGSASVRRDQEGTIDLLEMLMPVSAATETATTTPSAPNGPKPQVEIASFAVRQFRATFEDLSTPRPARNTIENLDLDVEKMTLAEGAAMPLRVALTLPRTGSATVSGNFVLSPLQATLAVDVANVSLASISPYIEPMVNVHLTQGAVSTKGEARVALPANQPMELEYKGDLSIDQFGAVDGVRNEELVGWSKLAVAGIDFKGLPVSVAIKEITWTDPKAQVLINRDGSINLLAALQPASGPGPKPAGRETSPDATPPPAEKTPLPKISIGSVKVTNGAFTFADRSVQPEVSTAINQFGGTITGLSSDNLASADVDLKATVGGSGPVTITGKLNPLGENKLVDLKVDIEGMELTPFSPYSGKFAGFELARGKLFLDVDAKVQNESVDMTNVVTMTQFTFGAPTNSPDATKLPVRLAVALLKDTEGKITLDVPVQGSLSDPSFRIGKVVARVIGNLLTKVATSPFSLLGAMFGGGGEELAFQEFAPGESELTPDNLKKLETLTKALKGRPALNLEIRGSFDAAADGQVLKRERLAQKVRSRIWDERRAVDADVPPPDQMEVTPEDELAMMQKMFVEAFPESAPELTALPPPTTEAVAVERKEPERKGFFRKAADIVTLKSWREGRSNGDEDEKTAAAPPPVVASPETAGPAWPSLEEMKGRLADLIEVTTDDHRRIAARRAERVREHFIQQEIAGERLFLANVNDEGNGARVFLQLQ